ncbi:MAG TPA: hypothetical protein RMH99_14980 [Sandaracinaceae bacterium LLY-WYZ-13_1]|nr:hypothetical protein [Sandaracinaceae bacterium LLY-WYZ-13_1]
MQPHEPRPAFHPWFELDVDADVALMTRTDAPFADLAEVERVHLDLLEALEEIDVPCLLTDLRAAPGRNDPGFERVLAPIRERIYAAFERRAVVVRSAIGRLQVQRHAEQDGIDMRVFLDPDEARRWLRSG